MSLQEVNAIADVIQVDRSTVLQRARLADSFGPDMPVVAAQWAVVAQERGLNATLKAHCARIPGDPWRRLADPTAMEVPEPWGPTDAWRHVNTPEDLDALLPPLER